MPASDWVRYIDTNATQYSDKFMAELLKNVQEYINPTCTSSVAEGHSIVADERFLGFRYVYGQHTILVVFLNKLNTKEQAWRLAFFSYDGGNIPADDIVGVIARAIIEHMTLQFQGKIPQGRGLYFYTNPESIQEGLILTQVLTRATELVLESNYSNYVKLTEQMAGGVVKWSLTFKGA